MTTTTALDLRPRGVSTIDLMRRETAESWRPWGSTYAMRAPPTQEERDVLGASLKEAEQIARGIKSKAEAVALLQTLEPAVMHSEAEKLGHLKACVQCALIDRWFPRKFINAKETP